jgi:hypothetical protein
VPPWCEPSKKAYLTASVASSDERHEKEVVVAIAKIYGPLGRDQSKSLLPQVLAGAAATALTALAAAGAQVVLKGGGDRNGGDRNGAGYLSHARPSQLDSAERAPVQEVHGGEGGGAGEGGGNGDNERQASVAEAGEAGTGEDADMGRGAEHVRNAEHVSNIPHPEHAVSPLSQLQDGAGAVNQEDGTGVAFVNPCAVACIGATVQGLLALGARRRRGYLGHAQAKAAAMCNVRRAPSCTLRLSCLSK